jgi:hypothetical protein
MFVPDRHVSEILSNVFKKLSEQAIKDMYTKDKSSKKASSSSLDEEPAGADLRKELEVTKKKLQQAKDKLAGVGRQASRKADAPGDKVTKRADDKAKSCKDKAPGPPVRMFYGSKVRAHLGWWKAQQGAARDAEGSRSTRMPVPAEVMFDILRLGLTTHDHHTRGRCACLVLCYSWYNCADSGVVLLRRHVTFDVHCIKVNVQGKTLPRNVACPIHRPRFARHDPLGLVLCLLQRWHDASAAWQRPGDVYWSLPSDSTVWRASIIDAWLK